MKGKFSVLEEIVFNPHKHLIQGTLNGNQQCFKQLYNLYAKAMYNTALRIVQEQSEAEDVLQESFLSAYDNLESYRFEASFGSWLKRIVVNKSLTVLKKRKLEFDTIDEDKSPLQNESDEADKTCFPKTVEQVVQAIKKLPDGYRTILSLYLIEGYDHLEISQILGISESTSKSQYSRAKKKLIQILNE